jgi:hypothetical protein
LGGPSDQAGLSGGIVRMNSSQLGVGVGVLELLQQFGGLHEQRLAACQRQQLLAQFVERHLVVLESM